MRNIKFVAVPKKKRIQIQVARFNKSSAEYSYIWQNCPCNVVKIASQAHTSSLREGPYLKSMEPKGCSTYWG